MRPYFFSHLPIVKNKSKCKNPPIKMKNICFRKIIEIYSVGRKTNLKDLKFITNLVSLQFHSICRKHHFSHLLIPKKSVSQSIIEFLTSSLL